MRWYVSRAGETVGPLDEEDVRTLARKDGLRSAQLRDEAGGAWVAAERSPFGSLMKERGWTGPIVAGLVVTVAGVAASGAPIIGALAGLVAFGLLALIRRM